MVKLLGTPVMAREGEERVAREALLQLRVHERLLDRIGPEQRSQRDGGDDDQAAHGSSRRTSGKRDAALAASWRAARVCPTAM